MEPEKPYDVFLSFRGSDTRQNFTAVLHDYMVMAGLRVFRDDDELDIGDKINTILEAINKSEICVPIFSETFAESKWCLLEVKRMVEFKKTIVPIFYKVSVDDVKLKSPRYNTLFTRENTYKKFMQKHEKKYGKEEVDKWKDALKAATENKGRVLLNQGYPEFCKDFINEVLKKLGPRERIHADVLIGVDDHLERFTELFDRHSDPTVRYICVHGMGGIGKTALSKAIFNKFSARFDCWKFIENVREKCTIPDGLSKLKKELQSNLDGSIQGKKLLIILDDVDEYKQINELVGQHIGYGGGSVIIVTTREKDILGKCYGLRDGQVIYFEMNCLQPQDALRLFCKKAFDQDTPLPDFKSLSEQVVAMTGRLPLALTVMGSLLHDHREKREIWKEVIKRSKDILINDVKKVLKISYDKLDHGQQQIFLDIACLPICRSKPSQMVVMWEACKFHPHISLSVLESKSLIKIQALNRDESFGLKYEWEKYEILIHDQLRDLGRDIVSEEGRLPLTECSRLWQDEEEGAFKVLKSLNANRQKVQALSLGNCKMDDLRLSLEQVGTLENLRFLHHDNGFMDLEEGKLGNLFPKLRYLRYYPSQEFNASNFNLPNLVTLDLSGSNICEDWGGWGSLFQGAESLKELILSECHQLKRTPYFPEDTDIERLDLSYCKNLATFHDSIGNLKCLKYLYIDATGIVELPSSIGSLVELKILSLEGTPIPRLPSSISALGKLEHLLVGNSHIREIPELPANLHELYVESEVLNKMGHISRLNNLVHLKLVGGKQVATSNLDAIERSSKLKSLDLCLDLREDIVLRINFNRLSQLEKLQLCCHNLKDVPLQLPSSLSSLRLWHVSSDTQLCPLPSSLNKLTLSEWSKNDGYETLGIENLLYLNMLSAQYCSFDIMEGLHLPRNIEVLEFDNCELLEELPYLSGCKNLKKLMLNKCVKLKEVSIPRDLKSLISLNIRYCISLEKIEGLFELENLQDIRIENCKVTRDKDEFGILRARRQGGNLLMGEQAGDGEEEEDESDEEIEEKWQLLWNESFSSIGEELETDFSEQATKLEECCDVLLCFIGRSDHYTQRYYCDDLYNHMVRAGIRVFRPVDDDQNETISEMESIKSPQICVPLFFETFTSTDDEGRWHLLQKVRWMLQFGKPIMPIFYRVSPYVVNDLVMMKLGNVHGIEQWKHALRRKLIYNEGRQGALDDQCHTNFYEEFLNEVLENLEPKANLDLDGLIGVEHNLARLKEMLNLEANDLQCIVIYGISGIGKTSLAKEFFNSFSASFDYSIFIDNAQESSSHFEILSILEELISDVSGYGKSGLLVLDEVDDSEQFEMLVKLAPLDAGSRMIITTRSGRVFKYCELLKLKGENVLAFKMEPLKPLDALQLFNKHAFMEVSPVPDLMGLSKEVVNSIGGFPLALIVLGSLLRNEEIEIWKYVIERLKDIPFKQVQEKLKISYESLSHNQQKIFVDIACFPGLRCNPVEAICMWENSKLYSTYGLAVLESLSLIKMQKDKKIWIHDQLLDLGRDIVCGESSDP
ncbi:hypothetical protein SAY87_018164 [Trapa incisa]|uniref:TIR domain-containing protein n=1 Tax=Trapa incisa TaxID=236973 RepID=A0AAN7QTJ2_9MYRT|nr:hypothetical protein SAY87_018164 [Trapa incisa]